jgi:hypothetical protein
MIKDSRVGFIPRSTKQIDEIRQCDDCGIQKKLKGLADKPETSRSQIRESTGLKAQNKL